MKYTAFIIIIFSVTAMFFFLQKDSIMSATRMNSFTGQTYAIDNLYIPKYETQSLLPSSVYESDSFYLFSTSPVTPDEKNTEVSLRARATNPFSEPAFLRTITIYKNDVQQYSRGIQLPIFNIGNSFTYDSDPIDLAGKDGQLNIVRIDFLFETPDGKTSIQKYEYAYLSLTPCYDDEDCTGPNSVCDLENVARLSQSTESYCVKPCVSNEFCYPGQVCINRRCGY